MTQTTQQKNLVQVGSIMEMRLAYYKSIAERTEIEAFVADWDEYVSIKSEKDARIAFAVNAKGEETIFGVPFKLLRE